MTDYYLLLTPFLMLLVVALVGFVGCDVVFGLDERVPDVIEGPTNLTGVSGTNTIHLTWEPPVEGTVSMYTIKRGQVQGSYSDSHDIDPPVEFYDDGDVVDGMTYYWIVTATIGGKESLASNVFEATIGYTGLTSLITPGTLVTLRNDFGAWAGMGFTIGAAPLVAKELGRFVVAGNMGTHTVKLVNGATKADVPGGSVSINTSQGSPGSFLHQPLAAPVTLNPGADYYVISSETSGGDQFYDSSTTTVTTTNVVSREYAVNGDGAGTYNQSPTTGTAYGPVDLRY